MTFETRPFDPAKHLQDEAAIAVFLASILEENNPALLAEAISTIARARGLNKIAVDPGLTREALSKALNADALGKCGH